MRPIAVLILALAVGVPGLGHARQYKFKYFVEVPPQHFTNPNYQHTFRPLNPLPTNSHDSMEAFQRPKARQVQVEFAPIYGTSVISASGVDGSRRSVSESRALAIGVRYGWNDVISMSFATDYGWWEESGASLANPDESANGSGFSDLHLGLLANHSISPRSTFFYGFEVGLSPGQRREGGRTSEGTQVDGNRYSGGHSFSPRLGWQYKLARSWLFGSRTDLRIRQEKRLVTADKAGEQRESGQNSFAFSAILEKKVNYGIFGGELRHEWNDPYSITDGEGKIDHRDSMNIISATLYWVKSLKNDLTLKPSFTYSTTPDRNRVTGYQYDQYDMMAFQILIRMEL